MPVHSKLFRAVVRDGIIRPVELPAFSEWVDSMEGKTIEVIVQCFVRSRSAAQNRYYRKALAIAAKELGYTTAELHEEWKILYLTNGEQHPPPSTATLDVEEMSHYIDRVLQFCAEHTITINERKPERTT